MNDGRDRAECNEAQTGDRGAKMFSQTFGGAWRVLVVDDMATNRCLVKSVLSDSHWEVTEASCGREALVQVCEQPFDAVLLDIMMPDIDGIAVCRQITADSPTRELPVIMLTSVDDVDAVRRAFEAGATDFVTKPFDDYVLVARVRSACERKRALDSLRTVCDGLEREVARRTEELRNNNERLLEEVRERMSAERELARHSQEMEQNNSKLDSALEMARAAWRLRTEFLNNISHELKTPLNGIMGMLGLLEETTLNAEQQAFLVAANRSCADLLRIINDTLDFARMEASGIDLDAVDFDLHELIHGVLAAYRAEVERKGLEIGVAMASTVPRWLYGDLGRLRRVLMNLVSNAVKFTDAGRVSISVEEVHEQDQAVVLKFRVKDTGVGVDCESRELIFEAFAQADGSRTRRHGGTGLGLSICKQIVEYMGGVIGVDSKRGQGSEFWFTVDLQKAFGERSQG